MTVQLPGDAFDSNLKDVAGPAVEVLHQLNLLPSDADLAAAGSPPAALGGPAQSVALIEAGATAFSKWWAAGAGTALVGVWGGIVKFWNTNGNDTQRVVLWAAAIISAALVLAIGYIVSSDLRGRALAAVATINARCEIARAVIQIAKASTDGPKTPPLITSLPKPIAVTYVTRPAPEEEGWHAIAMQGDDDPANIKFLVVKGLDTAWAPAAEVSF
jgi:hypothetical protein